MDVALIAAARPLPGSGVSQTFTRQEAWSMAAGFVHEHAKHFLPAPDVEDLTAYDRGRRDAWIDVRNGMEQLAKAGSPMGTLPTPEEIFQAQNILNRAGRLGPSGQEAQEAQARELSRFVATVSQPSVEARLDAIERALRAIRAPLEP
jgi:hypothetical protein